MQKQILEIRNYFVDQIIIGNFRYNTPKDSELIINIDWLKFNFYVVNGQALQMSTLDVSDNFMYLWLNKEEESQIGEIFQKIISLNIDEKQKQRDLQEYERIKKLYNLI